MHSTSYDFIIIGAGLSGLSFAYRLAPILRSQQKTLLIIEKHEGLKHDKHWCGWSNNIHPFESIVKKKWHTLQVGQYPNYKNIALKSAYQVLESKAFYQYTLNFLKSFAEVTLQFNCPVESISNKTVHTPLGAFEGCWLLDARQAKVNEFHDPFMLWQSFYGWVIKTKQPSFDESIVHYMNFHQNQNQGILFNYLLPFSSTEALVEPTYFLHHRNMPNKDHFFGLACDYLKHLNINDFDIIHEESGLLPMSAQPIKHHSHVISIGTSGGLLRPSSGYSFDGIQRHQDQLIQHYLKHHTLTHLKPYRARSLWMDKIFLKVLQQNPEFGVKVFTQLFNTTKIDTIVRFMSDEGSWLDCLSVILGVPKRPFIKALL